MNNIKLRRCFPRKAVKIAFPERAASRTQIRVCRAEAS